MVVVNGIVLPAEAYTVMSAKEMDGDYFFDMICQHICGNEATCTKKAVCTVCGIEYGELASHDHGTEWKSNGTSHWHECACGAKSDEAVHSGGTANCKEQASCSVCGTAYGELSTHAYENGKCTVCQAADPNYISKKNSFRTGDNSHMTLWIALLFISGGAFITLTIVDRKRRTTTK